MQVTALSSSDSVRLRLEDASPAEELRKGIRHRPDTLSGYSAARMPPVPERLPCGRMRKYFSWCMYWLSFCYVKVRWAGRRENMVWI